MIIGTQIDISSESFQRNTTAYHKKANEWQKLKQSRETSTANKNSGKLNVSERLNLLLDKNSDFFEIAPYAGYNQYEGVPAGAGLVSGIGKVQGLDCLIIANDPSVKGGTYFPLSVKKHLRAQEIAAENNLPCIYLADSGGAYLPLQDEIFPDKEHFGRIFYNQSRMSAAGIPQIAVVLGSCTAGGAYVPAMSDEAIIVKNQGTVFLGGPPLVKAATGEEVSAEDLGGADVHCKISGVCDHYAENENAALEKARQLIKNINLSQNKHPHLESFSPHFNANEIYGLIPEDPRKLLPTKEIIARITDGSEFEEFKEKYGTSIVCGFARFSGQLAGIIANNGILFSESALKAVHFIELCSQRKIPLVFLQNIVGFMVGKEYERRGITKDGAKLVTAVAGTNVPKITVIIGGSYGAGNYAMAGRAYQPRFLFTWPTAQTAVMGGEQAADVLVDIKSAALSKKGAAVDSAEMAAYHKKIVAEYAKKSTALYSSALLWDDGIIDPADTHKVISRALSICNNKPIAESKFGILRT